MAAHLGSEIRRASPAATYPFPTSERLECVGCTSATPWKSASLSYTYLTGASVSTRARAPCKRTAGWPTSCEHHTTPPEYFSLLLSLELLIATKNGVIKVAKSRPSQYNQEEIVVVMRKLKPTILVDAMEVPEPTQCIRTASFGRNTIFPIGTAQEQHPDTICGISNDVISAFSEADSRSPVGAGVGAKSVHWRSSATFR